MKGSPQNVRRTQDSDISFFRETQKKFDNQQKFSENKAYIGEQAIKIPKKKPKKGDLTELEKSQNKELSSEIIFVEHINN